MLNFILLFTYAVSGAYAATDEKIDTFSRQIDVINASQQYAFFVAQESVDRANTILDVVPNRPAPGLTIIMPKIAKAADSAFFEIRRGGEDVMWHAAISYTRADKRFIRVEMEAYSHDLPQQKSEPLVFWSNVENIKDTPDPEAITLKDTTVKIRCRLPQSLDEGAYALDIVLALDRLPLFCVECNRVLDHPMNSIFRFIHEPDSFSTTRVFPKLTK